MPPRNNPEIFALSIASLGDHAVTGNPGLSLGRCFRLASGVPDFDADGLYRDVSLVRPVEALSAVDFQQGTCQTSEMSFTLRHTPELGAWLGTYRHRRLGLATSGVNASTTSLDTDFNPGVGAHLIWERECLRVSAVSGAGPYTLTVQRGVLGTRATAHSVTAPGADRELFDARTGPNLQGQLIEFTRARKQGSSYGVAEEVLWRGILRDIQQPEPGVYVVQCDSLIALVREGELFREVFRARLETQTPDGWTYLGDGAPSASVGALGLEGVFAVDGAAALCPIYAYGAGEGRQSRIVVWPPDGPSGLRNTLAGASEPIPAKPPGEVVELLSTRPGSPASADPPDTNSLPFSDNALTLVLQLLTTSGAGDNGAYDLGIDGYGLDIPASLIDVDGIERLANQLGGGASVPRLWLNPEGRPVRAWELITRVLRPIHCVLRPARAGALGIVRLADVARLGELTTYDLGDALPQPAVRWERYAIRALDRVEASYNGRPGGKEDRVVLRDSLNLRRLPAAYTTTATLDLRHLDDLQAAQAAVIGYAARYHFPIPRVSWAVPRGVLNVDPGAVVYISGARFPGPDGRWGLDTMPVQIVSRRDDLRNWTTHYQAWVVGAASGAVGRWGLAATVVSYSAPDATIALNDYSHTDGPFDSDSDAWAYALANNDGDPVNAHILDSDLAFRGTVEIYSRTGNTLELNAPSVTPQAGDIITAADSVGVSALQLAAWAWMDAGYEWGV